MNVGRRGAWKASSKVSAAMHLTGVDRVIIYRRRMRAGRGARDRASLLALGIARNTIFRRCVGVRFDGVDAAWLIGEPCQCRGGPAAAARVTPGPATAAHT